MKKNEKKFVTRSSSTPETQKQTADTFQVEHQSFRALAEQSSDIIMLVNRQGVVIYKNNAAEKNLGLKTGETIGGMVFAQVHPDELTLITGALRTLFEHENTPTQRGEARIRDIDGNWRHFEIMAGSLRQNDVVEAVVINLRDITERRKVEENLRRSEEKYRSILENISEGYYEISLTGDMVFANDSGCAMLGYDRKNLYGLNYRQYSTPETRKRLRETFGEVFASGVLTTMDDYEIIRKDGSIRVHQLSVGLIRNEEGKPVGFRTVARDVTEKRQAEENLRRSEEKYRLLADHMKDQVWLLDLNLNIQYISPSVEKFIGYTLDELKRRPMNELFTRGSFEKAMGFFFVEMPGGLSAPSDYVLNRSLELEFRCRDGRTLWSENTFSFIRDGNGRPVSLLSEGRDITERKRVEEALRESEARYRQSKERYRSILDNMEEAYYEVDLKGNLTFFNATAVTNLGYTNAETMGMNFRQYVSKDFERKVVDAFHRVFLTGESIKGVDWELISKTGGKKPVESSISLMRDVQGTALGFRGIIRDITERKRAEEALRESEEKFRNFTETAQDSIITVNMQGVVTYVNPAARVFAGDRPVVGMPLDDFLPPGSIEQEVNVLDSLRKDFSKTLSYEAKITKPQDSCPVFFDVKASTLFHRGVPSGVLFVARDATERRRVEEEVRKMAIMDTLTGLYNRRGFIALAEQQMKTSARNDQKLHLFFIDLDDLKFINDTWGHKEGDRALKRTAVILQRTFRESDIIARLGGDEFAVLAGDGAELPEIVLKRLQGIIAEENAASDIDSPVAMSIGVSEYDSSAPCSIHDLIFRADQLMYRQKKEKKQKADIQLELPISR